MSARDADSAGQNIVGFWHKGHRVEVCVPQGCDHIPNRIVELQTFYEVELLRDAATRLCPGDLCIDVGANIGNHTIFFAKICAARTVAIEPLESNFTWLKRNIRKNGIVDRVRAIQCALDQESGQGYMEVGNSENTGQARLVRNTNGAVQIRKLDGLDIKKPAQVIKIDVEGMELAVLKGARRIISRDRPFIYAEAQTLADVRDMDVFLSSLGYCVTRRFNSTSTYLFEPAASEQEREAVVLRALAEMRGDIRLQSYRIGKLAEAFNERFHTYRDAPGDANSAK